MRRVRRLFLGLLGVAYLVAFLSLFVQIDGLIGSRGILPAADFLDWVRGRVGWERCWLLPTLCWLSSSDGFLKVLCGGGAALAILLILDVAPALVLFLLWAFYLSLVVVGQVFLGYQWDSLLLEAGLLAVLLAPLRLGPRAPDAPPSPIAVGLLRWLLFRLMFSSGLVKLLSGDPTWRGLTALRFHYETQPLPTWIGWYAHQLPAWFQTLSCLLMFAIEAGLPLLIFAPRRARVAAFFPFVGLQALIGLTGNYAFFIYRLARPFRSINSYGLFAVMTTSRPEIVILGSDDGVTWKPYEFRWKPGDPQRAPAFVEPHQPRLDWQMWFAALETCDENPWLVRFIEKIHDGSPEVLGLMDVNPFPSAPPRRIRAMLYDYRFTGFAERRSTGAWWRREAKGLYCPEVAPPAQSP